MGQKLLYREGGSVMRRTAIWLLIATALVLIGCIIFAGVMATIGWDFKKLSTTQYETNIYAVDEAFDSISIRTDTADIVFALSDDGTCKVVCYEDEKVKHSVTVEAGTLTVDSVDERSAMDHIGIHFSAPKVTIYLSRTEYASLFIQESTGDVYLPEDFSFEAVDIALSTGDVHFCASGSETIRVKTGTGHIRIENVETGSLELFVSTGDVFLADVTCGNLISDGNTGDISLKNVMVEEQLRIKRSTGDVRFDGCDAGEMIVKTDTGDVMGSLLTGKKFTAVEAEVWKN